MIFALAGNQNCGKTTLFNQLTGSNQHVGNFPGVTVDQKSGQVRGQKDCTVVDLPGIYSLRPYTAEEIVTRNFILEQKPDCIINIVDATNLERNLYLTLQLLTLQVPTVLALNMMDELTGNGGSVDTALLSELLGVPVTPICAANGEGVEELLSELSKYAIEGPQLFPEDMVSDQPERQLVAEIIREKMLRLLDREVPHGVAVGIERWNEREDGLVEINAVIYCEKASHKGIIIGKQGAMLKEIGRQARADIERMMDTKVYLELWVKVKEGWRNNQYQMRNFGYEEQ